MEPLILLALLACPVGMGAMMWFMNRGMKQEQRPAAASSENVDDLRSERARLTAEIDQLQSERVSRSAKKAS